MLKFGIRYCISKASWDTVCVLVEKFQKRGKVSESRWGRKENR